MTTAYQHRPLSKILAPATDPQAEGTKPKDSPEQQTKTDFTLPDKYKGKTAEEIAEMHMNAEKELGRMRNEVGTYRGLVNDLTSLQRQKSAEPQKVEQTKIDVSGDEIITDPAGAIDKVVTARLQERDAAESATREQTAFEMEGQRLMADFPDIDTVVASHEFQEFATRTPSRQADFIAAAQGQGIDQVRAARRLLEDFKDFESTKTPASTPGTAEQRPAQKAGNPGVQAAAKVSTEGAGPAGAVSTAPLIYEADVIKLIHSDPIKYRSPSFQKELLAAMREGRYVKQ